MRKNTALKVLVIFWSVSVFMSCHDKSLIQIALESAGSNRTELEKVLAHYRERPEDSLKLKAAIFLIENMPYHYTMESDVLNKYYQKIDSINKDTFSLDVIKRKFDTLYVNLGDPKSGMKLKEDIKTIKADYLISNIDSAFSSWENGKWAKHLKFDDFCEYILPYRIRNENIQDWRGWIENKYLNRISWLENEDDKRNSAYWAALYLNDQIKARGFNLHTVLESSPVSHPASILESMKMGICNDYAISATFIMRACGIPVCIDFTPQWPFRSHNHTWNVVLDNNGKDIPFMGGEVNPGYPNKPGYKTAKVFRYTYAYQKESLFALKGNEVVPHTFNTPFIRDVSDQYFKSVDVKYTLTNPLETKNKFAYLAVFDNQNWIPVQWGDIKDKYINFKQLGKGIVYMPVLFENNKIVAFDAPILLTETDEMIKLIPDHQTKQRLVLKRKFPVFGGVLYYSSRQVNARIVASNRADFKDSVIVGTITRNPLMHYDTIQINETKPYRYWRYYSPDNGFCNIAEMEFYKDNVNITSAAKIFSDHKFSGNNKPENAVDNDGLTFYETKERNGGWIGLDFGKPVTVDCFRYLPRNDDNNIQPGNKYELYYWENNAWQSFGACKAASDSLMFNNVPTKALYLLRNHTRGKEERIFTYENGKQVWW